MSEIFGYNHHKYWELKWLVSTGLLGLESIARGPGVSKLKKLMQGIKGIYFGKGDSHSPLIRRTTLVIQIQSCR